jgi:two-component system, NarL family, response regulator NreC
LSKKIKVLICDDHAMFREGIKAIVGAHPQFKIVGEASEGYQAVNLAANLHPDVVLMDISMPGLKGFEATRRIHRRQPNVSIVILTIYEDDSLVARCLEAGAVGYVLKDTAPEQLIYAIEAASRGERYLSPRVLRGVVSAYLIGGKVRTKYESLTDREREILTLLAEGLPFKDVAERLNLSVKTVDAHKVNLMRKLGIHDRTGLVRYAIREKLIHV